MIDKSTALAGGALTVTVFNNGFDFSGGASGSTLKPCVTFGNESKLYIVNRNEGFAGTRVLRMSEITGTGPSPSWSVTPGSVFANTGIFFVNNNFSFSQINVSQQGTTSLVQTNDTRLLNAVFSNGKIWTTHSGGLPVSGGVDRTAVFWYQLDPALMASSGAPIVQSGAIDGGSGVHHFFPSIAVNSNDDACIDTSRFVEAVGSCRSSGDTAGTMGTITVIKAGEDSYIKDFGGGRIRWGDYSATVVDPPERYNILEYPGVCRNGCRRQYQ